MSQVSRSSSKGKFLTGATPSQSDFADLHDSAVWYDEVNLANTVLSGTSWDINASPYKELSISANTSLTIVNAIAGKSRGFIIVTNTGTFTLQIAGVSVTLNASAKTGISVIALLDGTFYISSDAGGGAVITAPSVTGMATTDATHIAVTFNEAVTSTMSGWSFKKNGSALTPSAVSGSGTATLTFTVPTIASGDILLASYNSTNGDCADAASHILASFTDQSVTNNVGGSGSQLATPTLTLNAVGSTEIDASWTSITNAQSYMLQRAYDSAFAVSPAIDYSGTGLGFNKTGLAWGVDWWDRIKAVGDGTIHTDSNWSGGQKKVLPPPFTYTGPGNAINFDNDPILGGTANPCLTDTNGLWTTPSTNGQQGQPASHSTKKPSGVAGGVGMAWDGTHIGGVITLSKQNAPTVYSNANAVCGFWITGTTSAPTIQALWGPTGSNTNAGSLPTGTTHIYLHDDGAGNFTIQTSTDGGTTWTTLYTFPTANASFVGDMWVSGDVYGASTYAIAQPFKIGF